MTEPTTDILFETLEVTWPPAEVIATDQWTLRRGEGGGQRVSAATPKGEVDEAAINVAETAMRRMNQSPLFMIRDGDSKLDTQLEARGYSHRDHTTLYVAAIKDLPSDTPRALTFATWPTFGIQEALWNQGGIGPERLAVMHRAPDPKTTILGRTANTPAATAFVAIHDGCAMLHALEVTSDERRKGVGTMAVAAAVKWAATKGADWMSLAVVTDNEPANQLYRKLGFQPAGHYHYRRAAA